MDSDDVLLPATADAIVNGSYVPTGDTKQASKFEDKLVKALKTVGAFQKLPMVMPSIDILYSALRKAKRVSPTKGIANIAKRERNKGAKQLDALMKELAVPFRKYTVNFPEKISLHPYERSLVELTLGDGNYEEANGIDQLVIPTRDYLFAPSFGDINRAVDFIHRNALSRQTTYVHCKAGRGRSTTIVLCYLFCLFFKAEKVQ